MTKAVAPAPSTTTTTDMDVEQKRPSSAANHTSFGREVVPPRSNKAQSPPSVLESERESSDFDEEQTLRQDLKDISFGALAQVQSTTHTPGSHQSHTNVAALTPKEKLAELRKQLTALKSTSAKRKSTSDAELPCKPSKHPKRDDATTQHARPSKHAPHSQSSKRAVPRYRPALEAPAAAQDPAVRSRDPRFDSATTGVLDKENVRKKYAFLERYAEGEVAELRESLAALSKSEKKRKKMGKDKSAEVEQQVESFKREIGARENRLRAQRVRDETARVKREVRQKEKESVRQGKKPFYLKRGKMRDVLEERRMEGMKKGESEKLEGRRRKREGEKEAKRLRGVRRRRSER